MIIALVHAGDLDNALAHGLRPLERNVAFLNKALILHAKDTTNDASNVMILFQEAGEVNVEINLYIYNGMISKLTQAQKADNTLELFQKMKTQSVNYLWCSHRCMHRGWRLSEL